jgi:hypothetical protein
MARVKGVLEEEYRNQCISRHISLICARCQREICVGEEVVSRKCLVSPIRYTTRKLYHRSCWESLFFSV